MQSNLKILAFSGSARKDSWNKKLVSIAAAGAREAGAEVTLLDLREYPMPIYDGDLEAESGLPENAKRIKKLMLESGGFLISAPEYNSSITPLLKNVIDWASRPAPGEGRLACYQWKIAGIMAASPGALGGLRGLVHLRAILENIGVMVIPDQLAVGMAPEAFAPDGSLKNGDQQNAIKKIGARVAQVIAKLGR
ncbi:NAD(P)H-dependent oxidoreductase [Candidatus Sumerlaeota bacterium]|nr:NAD(P)H-dependent oxidoreductase [Candidatus Sumerlaeota bacterium]